MEKASVDQSETLDGTDQEPSSLQRIGHVMADLKAKGNSGASWFYYIAALSLVNTVVIHLDIKRRFIIGLAITLLIDAIAKVMGQQNPQIATAAMTGAICFSVLVSGIAVLFGWLARNRYNWVFGIGMFLYLLDGLLYVLLQDYPSAAFHAYAIYGMYRGIRAFQQLRRLEDAVAQAAVDDLADPRFQPDPQLDTP